MKSEGSGIMTRFLSHRGESDDAPENTLEAFQLAMARDSDGIELDIRLTADNQVVCVHDETLDRITGVPLAVRTATLAELRRYFPVPLFAEALAALLPGKAMQIELKGTPEVIPGLKAILDGWRGDRRRLTISSFEAETIRAAADAFPDLARLLLVDVESLFGHFPTVGEVVRYLEPLRCGISFRASFAAAAEWVRALQRLKFGVVCWGVASDELGLRMAELGVDALTCNHAVALRRRWNARI